MPQPRRDGIEGLAGIPQDERSFYFRTQNDKANLSPPEKAEWFRMNNVDLTNGDQVGVACPWKWPELFDGISTQTAMKVQRELAEGKYRKDPRSEAWVGNLVAKPRVIMLENVEEFRTWGPLVVDGDGKSKPCPKNKGREFNAFCNALRRQGYHVEHRELRACDYGTPTIRKRLFLIARRDGNPIVWPSPTHGDPRNIATKANKLKPWRTAAECIDFSLPCPSIFERQRPLAAATLRRIAKGIMRYVVNAADPFIVNTANSKTTGRGPNAWDINEPTRTITSAPGFAVVAPVLTEHANASTPRCMPADEPLRTICAQTKGGHHALVSALITKFRTGATGHDLADPLHTITAGPKENPAGAPHALGLVTANLIHMGHGDQCSTGARRWSDGTRDIEQPLNTATASSVHAAVVTSNLVKMRGDNVGQDDREPLQTISAQGTHFAEVRAFLIKYYGSDQDPRLEDPLHTVTTKDRYGLVTVAGEEYAIADIGLRMLAPRELFKAQGFPDSYITEWGIDPNGQRIKLTKSAQVRMCGNSVCPPLAQAIVGANFSDFGSIRRVA